MTNFPPEGHAAVYTLKSGRDLIMSGTDKTLVVSWVESIIHNGRPVVLAHNASPTKAELDEAGEWLAKPR